MSRHSGTFREHLGQLPAERTVPTGSMRPLIREGDRIRFQRTARAPRPGEIWVAELGAQHICHRVLWVRGGRALFKGDACLRPDGWIPLDAFFGPLSHIARDDEWRPTNRRRDRALGLALSLLGSLRAAAFGAGRRLGVLARVP
jgi:hypothetical protein